MATSEPVLGRQKSREELELTGLNIGAKPTTTSITTTTACSVEVLTSGPPFGESRPQQKVQFQEQRVEDDGSVRCIGRAGTVHNPDPQPEFVTSEEFFDHTPTPGLETRGRLASESDGPKTKKPYINLHKVSYHKS